MQKNWMKLGVSLLTLIMIIGVLAGCSTNSGNAGNVPLNDNGNSAVEKQEPAGQESAGDMQSIEAFPAVFIDGSGEEITIEEQPETIVSLLASNTEIAYALGLGEKIIGVSDFCNYPTAVEEKEKLGGQDMNVERILELQPDMALVSQFHYNSHADILETFRMAGIDVVVAGDAKSFEDAYETIRMFGQATGTLDKAEVIVANMKERLAEVVQRTKDVSEPKRIWVEVSPAPDIFTTGQNTFLHEMIETINAVNVAGDQTGWVKMTEEEIVTLMPDVIVTTYGYYVDNPADGVYAREGWANIPAVLNEQIYDVDSDKVTRPGPRLIDGVEELARVIYPEQFTP